MADQQIHHHHSADSSTMEEELMNSIRRGCELAKKLESDLPNLVANHQQQPRMLWLSIDEIVNTFNAAKEKLLASQMMVLEAATSMQQQEYGNTMDQFLMQQLQATAPYNMMMTNNFPQLRSRGSEAEAQALSPSRPPRSGKKVELEKITKMVAAPEFGNTDLPSDIDGFSWRKYGQKEILGAKYPRSYYRCTHQKLYQCLAKKQVQRNDEDPSMFQVTYRGTHTCHMSSTAPSSSIIPQHQRLLLELELDMPHDDKPTQPISHLPSPSSASASASGRWLEPMNLSLQMGGGGGGGGCDYPVVDMADAMFNSGSSSGNNSMETLFPSNED